MKNTRRESASLIIAAKNYNTKANSFNYNILLLKRSDQTAVTVNQVVFPGGIFESADESSDWIKYFHEFGISQCHLKQLSVLGQERPNILAPQGNGCYDRFFKKSIIWAREISLRLTAIRETFEEVGILLCRSKLNIYAPTGFGHFRDDFDKHFWQKLIHNDAKEFLNLCRELEVIPDLWGLHEWSAWASPAPILKGFETVFFIVNLLSTPDILTEATEVKEALWQNPLDAIHKYRNSEISFLPPQVYELSRLLGIKKIDDLVAFSQSRSNMGTTLYLPVVYICTDGTVSVLPGDDCYLDPSNTPNIFIPTNVSVEEFRKRAKRIHRCENIGMPNFVIRLNFPPPDGHLEPHCILDCKTKL